MISQHSPRIGHKKYVDVVLSLHYISKAVECDQKIPKSCLSEVSVGNRR